MEDAFDLGLGYLGQLFRLQLTMLVLSAVHGVSVTNTIASITHELRRDLLKQKHA